MMAGIVRPLVHNISLYLLIYCAAESKLRKPIFVRQASAGLVTISFFFELKWRAICLIEDSRFGKDFFGKF